MSRTQQKIRSVQVAIENDFLHPWTIGELSRTILASRYLTIKPAEEVDKHRVGSLPSNRRSLSSLDINWKEHKQTLVLALSSNCHFCTASADFYRKLAEKKNETRFVAVFPQPVQVGKDYLVRLGITVDEVRQLDLNQLGVHGTPTLLFLDDTGMVTNSWTGLLSMDQEAEVMSKL